MKILICPDSFKGSLSSLEAAEAMRLGAMEALPGAETVVMPIGDGGEGTAEAVSSSFNDTEEVVCETVDPLHRPIKASYRVIEGNVAVIESAAAGGLTLLAPEERDIMHADTYGTGLLIADAYRRGIRHFLICMGGSATCDGGFGAFRALQTVFPETVFPKPHFTLLCDVENPLLGPQGAAPVFAPQKGASIEDIPLLERRLKGLADYYRSIGNVDISHMKYAGAAGGLAGMLMACYDARAVSGIKKVLEITDFESKLKDVSLVLTGEGKGDATTLHGKAPRGILDAASGHGVPVALVCGRIEEPETLLDAGFKWVIQATPPHESANPSTASLWLTRAVSSLLREINHEL